MPAKQALGRQRRCVIPGRVQHHFDDAFDVAVRWGQGADVDPKTSRQIMRLIRDICAERGLPTIINIHDVPLATQFTDRIIGLQAGRVVFDGPPADLDDDALTSIYGEEDWAAMRLSGEGDEDDRDGAQVRAVAELARKVV